MKLFGSSRQSKHAGGGSDAFQPDDLDVGSLDDILADVKGEASEDTPKPVRKKEPEPEPEPEENFVEKPEEDLEVGEKKRSASGKKQASGKPAASRKQPGSKKKKLSKAEIVLRALMVVMAVLIVAVVGTIIYLKNYMEHGDLPEYRPSLNPPSPPDSQQTDNQDPNSGDQNSQTPVTPPDKKPNEGKEKPVYTFVLAGVDKATGSLTDTIMVATFDPNDYSLGIVSIPRDTLVNVSQNGYRKANGMLGMDRKNKTELIAGIKRIIGYEPMFYVIADMAAFEKAVDAIGGVWFDVPRNMNYTDEAQDLYINIKKGYQKLSGKDALKVWRFRKGYADQDIGRLQTQHDLMMAAAKQLLENADDVPITTLVNILYNDVETNIMDTMDIDEGLLFAKEFLKIDINDIHIMTIPAKYDDYVYGVNYCIIDVDEWLPMLNQYISAVDDIIVAENLSILTRDANGRIYSTNGVYEGRKSWGNDG